MTKELINELPKWMTGGQFKPTDKIVKATNQSLLGLSEEELESYIVKTSVNLNITDELYEKLKIDEDEE